MAQARTARKRHEEQTNADRERRITESFAKAVEQLGSEKLETRLGAIYTLERLSRESEREYWPIMETLTAYVREHAPWLSSQAAESPSSDGSEDQEKELGLSNKRVQPATDVQAILTVLGRREARAQKGKDQRLDLSATDLRGANLEEAHLERTILMEAHLKGAWLRRAYLKEALLVKAHLEEANLEEAHLEGAILEGAHLERTILMEAHLKGAWLRRAYLKEALLMKAHLEGAILMKAHLEGAIGLTQEQIDSASGDEDTTLPEGLKRPARWSEPLEPPFQLSITRR